MESATRFAEFARRLPWATSSAGIASLGLCALVLMAAADARAPKSGGFATYPLISMEAPAFLDGGQVPGNGVRLIEIAMRASFKLPEVEQRASSVRAFVDAQVAPIPETSAALFLGFGLVLASVFGTWWGQD